MLLNDRNTYAVAPNLYLLYGSSPESVGSAQIYFLASLFKLIGELANSGCLAHSVYANHQNNIWFMAGWKVPVFGILGVVLG